MNGGTPEVREGLSLNNVFPMIWFYTTSFLDSTNFENVKSQ